MIFSFEFFTFLNRICFNIRMSLAHYKGHSHYLNIDSVVLFEYFHDYACGTRYNYSIRPF